MTWPPSSYWALSFQPLSSSTPGNGGGASAEPGEECRVSTKGSSQRSIVDGRRHKKMLPILPRQPLITILTGFLPLYRKELTRWTMTCSLLSTNSVKFALVSCTTCSLSSVHFMLLMEETNNCWRASSSNQGQNRQPCSPAPPHRIRPRCSHPSSMPSTPISRQATSNSVKGNGEMASWFQPKLCTRMCP